jgi:hypothetical protein
MGAFLCLREKEMDYFITYQEGDLDNDHNIVQVRVKGGVEFVDKIQVDANREEYDDVKETKVKTGKTFKIVKEKVKKVRLVPVYADIENGYGNDRPQAVADFIRRNSSKVLNAIFDYKEGV